MIMSDKLYNALKWVALVARPAVSALYLTLSGIWGLPYGEQVAGTSAAVDTCLGAFLGISSAKYYKARTSQNDK